MNDKRPGAGMSEQSAFKEVQRLYRSHDRRTAASAAGVFMHRTKNLVQILHRFASQDGKKEAGLWPLVDFDEDFQCILTASLLKGMHSFFNGITAGNEFLDRHVGILQKFAYAVAERSAA